MSDVGWSPADQLHAVALSEANAWKDAMLLCAARMQADRYEQTDARLFLMALRLLLRAQKMASDAVAGLPSAAAQLRQARRQFDRACPGAKDARDMIEHFAEYAEGRGNRQASGPWNARPVDPVLAARDWPLSYDRADGRIRLGSLEVDVAVACEQAKQLLMAIWKAVRGFEAQV